MAEVFICYCEEDGALARYIAAGLEKSEYGTWYYERDSRPGVSYITQVHEAIKRAIAVVVIISRKAFSSSEMDMEITHVHTFEKKLFMPVLVNLSHEEFQDEKATWAMLMGAAPTLSLRKIGRRGVVSELRLGLDALLRKKDPEDRQPEEKLKARVPASTFLLAAVFFAAVVAAIFLLPQGAIEGAMKVFVWRGGGEKGVSLNLKNPEEPPLKPGEKFRVEVYSSRPAYAYLFWIGSEGRTTPVYPWQTGGWEKYRADQRPISRLSLPEGPTDLGWEIPSGKPGMETIILLLRDSPLPEELDLKGCFSNLPTLEMAQPRGAFVFDNWKLKGLRRGDLNVSDAVQVFDPVLGLHRTLEERLAKHATYSYALSFANQGN